MWNNISKVNECESFPIASLQREIKAYNFPGNHPSQCLVSFSLLSKRKHVTIIKIYELFCLLFQILDLTSRTHDCETSFPFKHIGVSSRIVYSQNDELRSEVKWKNWFLIRNGNFYCLKYFLSYFINFIYVFSSKQFKRTTMGRAKFSMYSIYFKIRRRKLINSNDFQMML